MPDILCLSHLRWRFVYQRPQHLMTRASQHYRVFYFEEPEAHEGIETLRVERQDNVTVVTPLVPHGLTAEATNLASRAALHELLEREQVRPDVLWFYTPMALEYADELNAPVTVFDCMDELSGFKGANPALRQLEVELMRRADVVFVGGRSLYESRLGRHARLHLLPSSVDIAHFAQARDSLAEPADMGSIPRPRLGFFGVIDERLNTQLLAGVAEARPDWQLVMVGPTAKIDAADLPVSPNLHWLGPKPYAELPAYLGSWDVALMPFAQNEATRYISPTKTPEYLAAGRPVVSTSIPDVVSTYAASRLVQFGDTTQDFVAAIERALAEDIPRFRARADALLKGQSWDATWASMHRAIDEVALRAPEPYARSVPPDSRVTTGGPAAVMGPSL